MMKLSEVYKTINSNLGQDYLKENYFNSENDSCCIIACFIPNEYHDDIERHYNTEFVHELDEKLGIIDHMPIDNMVILRKWQKFHDENKSFEDSTRQQRVDALFNKYVELLNEHGIAYTLD